MVDFPAILMLVLRGELSIFKELHSLKQTANALESQWLDDEFPFGALPIFRGELFVSKWPQCQKFPFKELGPYLKGLFWISYDVWWVFGEALVELRDKQEQHQLLFVDFISTSKTSRTTYILRNWNAEIKHICSWDFVIRSLDIQTPAEKVFGPLKKYLKHLLSRYLDV